MVNISLEDLKKFIGRYSIGRDGYPYNTMGSLHFLRIKIPCGILNSNQFREIASIASKYGRDLVEITDRQNIQLHWIKAEDAIEIFSQLDKLGFTTDMCGQGFKGAKYGDVRNIISCPASGLEKDEILECHPIVRKLTEFFTGNPSFLDLPRKFKIAATGCGSDCVRAAINDLAFIAVKKGDQTGFTILVGGSIGASYPGPILAKHAGIFIEPKDVFDVAVAAAEIHRDYSSRESKAKARFKYLIESWGLGKFIHFLEKKVGKNFDKYEGAIFTRRSLHEGVQTQKDPNLCYVNIPIIGGRITSQVMINLADLSEKFGTGELRLTPTQNILIPNVKKEEKDVLLKYLKELGFNFDVSFASWTSVGCSSDFCGKTLFKHAKDVVKDVVTSIEKTFSNEIIENLKLEINASGCPNNCGGSLVSPIGLIGKQKKVENRIGQFYDVYVSDNSSIGFLIRKDVPSEEAADTVVSLISEYVVNKKPEETLLEFCKRKSNEPERKS
ncbi:MAG: nitrite/sulfite reductase [Candidatus Bathyarchaeia archaeon]